MIGQNNPQPRVRRQILAEDRWALYLIASIVVLTYAWGRWFAPTPGDALVACGLVAVVMVVRMDVSALWEKVLWVVLACGLLFCEIKTARSMNLASRTFMVCRFLQRDGATVDVHGSTPIQSAKMYVENFDQMALFAASHIDDGDRYQQLVQSIPLESSAGDAKRVYSVQHVETSGDVRRYRISFVADNGIWWEDLQTVLVEGRLVQALRIRRWLHFKPTTLFESQDPDFPGLNDHRITWDWAAGAP